MGKRFLVQFSVIGDFNNQVNEGDDVSVMVYNL